MSDLGCMYITLSPVLSKLFESVLFGRYEEFLGSDDLQFGFKKNSSTNTNQLNTMPSMEQRCSEPS